MSKRRKTSGGSLTGGTGDVKPQFMVVTTGLEVDPEVDDLYTGISGANDDYTVATQIMPVPRFGTMKGMATVVEMLELHWYLATENLSDLGATHWAFLSANTTRVSGDTSTLASYQSDIANTKNFGVVGHHNLVLTSGGLSHGEPKVINLTDHNGNGMLFPFDEIDIVQGDVGAATVHSSTVRILYRLVNVGIEEYVGMVAQHS